MGDDQLQQAVLDELGDDRVQELADDLGTDAEGAKRVVAATVEALPEELTGEAEGLAGPGGGLAVGVLGRISGPVARAVAKRTGLSVGTVSRGLELLLPVVLGVIAKRRRRG
ncbi:DUF937 domain-containing protein [Streptomyces sp. UNOC14_S4]|uniref:DUF937 domain-containing protein n=1 Tax=Streptomyces sp. UNOC14_S4 TaxID=2872340 RepID=UPI001E3BB5B0|nr:DUF937 domain-containing protein [Streptomyces sp. UNOC14_S4]MCC3772010.1 DUF937 domain-containing protein [Streptomyces sp. UNOC14_S4]